MAKIQTDEMDEMDRLLQQEAEIKQKIEAFRAENKERAIEAVRAQIAKFGLTQRDCGFAQFVNPPAQVDHREKKHVKPKYISPTGETWTGRGRTPKWIDQHPKESWDQFAVKEEEQASEQI